MTLSPIHSVILQKKQADKAIEIHISGRSSSTPHASVDQCCDHTVRTDKSASSAAADSTLNRSEHMFSFSFEISSSIMEFLLQFWTGTGNIVESISLLFVRILQEPLHFGAELYRRTVTQQALSDKAKNHTAPFHLRAPPNRFIACSCSFVNSGHDSVKFLKAQLLHCLKPSRISSLLARPQHHNVPHRPRQRTNGWARSGKVAESRTCRVWTQKLKPGSDNRDTGHVHYTAVLRRLEAKAECILTGHVNGSKMIHSESIINLQTQRNSDNLKTQKQKCPDSKRNSNT